MVKLPNKFILPLVMFLLAACSFSPGIPTSAASSASTQPATVESPVFFSPSTEIPPTEIATPEDALAPTASPTATLEPPNGGTPISEEMIATLLAAHITPTRIPSPTPSIPLSYLYINRPGPLSRVTSPISLIASVIPGPGGVVRIELIGENGRVLMRTVERYNMPKDTRFGISTKINFEIPGVSELARLQVSVDDAHGRPVAESAIRLILFTLGENEINAQDDFQDPFFVSSPKADATLSGGSVTVQGRMRPFNNNPVYFELINENGQIVGARELEAHRASNDDFQPFMVQIPYRVSKATPVRLVIHQPDDGISGNIALSSLTLTLAP